MEDLTAALLAFFVLTFALTWTAWASTSDVGGPVFLLGVFAPAIVALVLTARREGRAGVARLLARIGTWRVGGRYYLFAAGYMAGVKLLAAAIHRVAMGRWPEVGDGNILVMLGALLVSTWVQAGEEIGWRGYALPRLAERMGWGGAGVLLGAIWALWHLPLFYKEGGGTEGQSFPLYLLFVTAFSVAMAWLYWKTGGSLLLTMLMHAAFNNTSLVPLALPHGIPPMSFEGLPVAWAAVGVAWGIALALLWQMRRADPRAV